MLATNLRLILLTLSKKVSITILQCTQNPDCRFRQRNAHRSVTHIELQRITPRVVEYAAVDGVHNFSGRTDSLSLTDRHTRKQNVSDTEDFR